MKAKLPFCLFADVNTTLNFYLLFIPFSPFGDGDINIVGNSGANNLHINDVSINHTFTYMSEIPNIDTCVFLLQVSGGLFPPTSDMMPMNGGLDMPQMVSAEMSQLPIPR